MCIGPEVYDSKTIGKTYLPVVGLCFCVYFLLACFFLCFSIVHLEISTVPLAFEWIVKYDYGF